MRKIASIIITILILLVFASCNQDPIPIPSVEEVSLDSALRTVEVDGEFTLHATVIAKDGADTTVTWVSSNESVATVDSDGKVTAKAEGKNAFIYAKAGNKSARCLVMVLPDIVSVESVSIDRYFAFIAKGETLKLNAVVKPDNATFEDVTWASSNEAVATVNEKGEVKAVAESGTASITVTVGDKTAKCEVEILPEPILVKSITLDKHFTTVAVGANATLKATVNPDNASYYKVVWESSNEKVVTVNNGVLTGVGEGFANVTATAGNRVAICKVAVDKNTVTVKYDANYEGGKTWEQEIPKNKTANLSDVMFSGKTEDYIFAGWNTKKDYTGDMFCDGEAVEFSEDVTLYAQWIWHDLFAVDNDGTLKRGGGFDAHYEQDLHDNVCLPKTIGGKQVKAIGKELFLYGNFGGIKQIKIPEGVTDIRYQAFHDCTELYLLHIPASLNDHDASAFSCSWKMHFKVHPDNARYTTDDDGNMLLSKDKTILYSWPTCSDPAGIPEGIVEIGASAFQYSGLSGTLVLPSTVKRIGSCSFYWTNNLTGLQVMGDLESIDNMAFESYPDSGYGLKTVVFEGDVGTICDSALSVNFIETVEFKGNIKQINEHAFLLAWYLKEGGLSITIRGGGEPANIDPKAFEGANIREILVQPGLVDEYKAKWSVVADKIQPLEG